MNGKVQRISPRVSYRARAHIERSSDGILAEAAELIDLGLGGLAFESTTPFAVRDPVACELSIGGLRTRLPGTIAWSRAMGDDPRQRCGVAFNALPEQQQGLVYQAVVTARAGGQPVTLRFVDMNRQMEALALADTGGLRIRTPFPMLTSGTRVALQETKANATAAGVVTAVDLDRSGPIPVLEFRVMLDAWPRERQGSAPTTRATTPPPTSPLVELENAGSTPPEPVQTETPEPGAVEAHSEPAVALATEATSEQEPIASVAPTTHATADTERDPAAEAPSASATPEPPPLRPTGAPTAPQPESSAPEAPTEPPPSAPEEPEPNTEAAPMLKGASTAPKPPRHLSAQHGLRTRTLALAALLTVALIAIFVAFGPLRGQLSRSRRASNGDGGGNTAENADTDTQASTMADTSADAVSASPTSPTETDDTAPATAPLRAPEVVSDSQGTLIRLPAHGSADGMVVQLWKQPAGIALQLPSATISLPARRYPFKRDNVAYVRVGEPHQRTALQVVVEQPIRQQRVTLHNNVLEVSLTF